MESIRYINQSGQDKDFFKHVVNDKINASPAPVTNMCKNGIELR